MVSFASALLLAASSVVSAQSGYGGYGNYGGNTSAAFPPFSGDPLQKYTLTANGINASFIPYGARLTNLYVNDKNGTMQDVVLGYDDPAQYIKDTETNHTYFGPIVGRYANR